MKNVMELLGKKYGLQIRFNEYDNLYRVIVSDEKLNNTAYYSFPPVNLSIPGLDMVYISVEECIKELKFMERELIERKFTNVTNLTRIFKLNHDEELKDLWRGKK